VFSLPAMSIMRTAATSLSLVVSVVACTPQVAPEPRPTPKQAAETPVVEPAWVARYGARGNYTPSVTDIVLSPDGGTVFVSGGLPTGRPACAEDFATAAFDTIDGAELWTATYDGPAHWCDHVYAIAVSPDATKLFVIGTSFPSGASDMTTIAYDASDGRELWVATHDGPISGQDNGVDVVSTNKTVFVTGDVNTKCFAAASTCYSAMVTIAYDATRGNRRWLATYAVDRGSVSPGQMVASPDGRKIFVTGVTRGTTAVTIAYTASTGAKRWVVRDRRLLGNAPQLVGDWLGNLIGISADGRTLFVAGGLGPADRCGHGVVAYAASDGSELWRLTTSHDCFRWPSIVPSPTSHVVFLTDEDRDHYLVVAIDATTGAALWRSTYHGPCDEDVPNDSAVSPNGSRIYVTGYSERPGGHACPGFGTIGLDAADGRRLWTNAAGFRATDIAVDDDGAVYLAGNSGSRLLTFRLDPVPV
jgi:outer membrane protein assembly factor BamB